MAVTTLAMGFLITLVIRWSGARTYASGLKSGALFASLFWVSMNSALYASSHHFSGLGALVDTPFSILAMTIAGAVAARLLRDGETIRITSAG